MILVILVLGPMFFLLHLSSLRLCSSCLRMSEYKKQFQDNFTHIIHGCLQSLVVWHTRILFRKQTLSLPVYSWPWFWNNGLWAQALSERSQSLEAGFVLPSSQRNKNIFRNEGCCQGSGYGWAGRNAKAMRTLGNFASCEPR